jgi:hypothetical protein
MKKNFTSVFIAFLLVSIIVGFFSFVSTTPVQAQGGDSGFLENCPTDSIDPRCQPPTLQSLEFIFAKLIIAAWALGGLLWLGYFIAIAVLYFTDDPGKVEEAKKRFGRWLIGFALFYLSWIIVANVLDVMIADGSECYKQFDGYPGFVFFFPEVCEPSNP